MKGTIVLLCIASKLRDISYRLSFTKDDIIEQYHSYTPQIHEVGGEISINNIVSVGDSQYKVFTNLYPIVYSGSTGSDENYIRVDFTTSELNDQVNKAQSSDDIYEINVKKKIKDMLLKGDSSLSPSVNKSISEIAMYVNSLEEMARRFWIVYNKEDINREEQKIILNIYGKVKEYWGYLRDDVESDVAHEFYSPTLNVEGLSTKVFSSVILSIREGLKRLFKRYPNKMLHGLEIDSKPDYAGDKRRAAIYQKLFSRYMSMIIGDSIPYTIENGPGGQLYKFKEPLSAKMFK